MGAVHARAWCEAGCLGFGRSCKSSRVELLCCVADVVSFYACLSSSVQAQLFQCIVFELECLPRCLEVCEGLLTYGTCDFSAVHQRPPET